MARGWQAIAREAARTACFVASFGLIAYLGMSTVIKIEATRTRLFLVVVVFGIAFGAASLLDHLLRDRVPTDTQPNGELTEIWPRWYSQPSDPIVYRWSDHEPVLPRLQFEPVAGSLTDTKNDTGIIKPQRNKPQVRAALGV